VTTPSFYQIKVKGHLDPRWSEWFDRLAITHEPNGETLLTGPVADQAALLGLLLKLHDLNLTLLSLHRLKPDSAETDHPPPDQSTID
jgi:hypothetical protein